MKALRALLVFTFLHLPGVAAPLDLAGEWRFALDPQDHGIHALPANWKFPDVIHLPGMVNAQGFGEKPSIRTSWTGDGWRYPDMFREWQADDHFKFPFFLQPPRHYVGPAWFQREIVIPDDWQGRGVTLHLERVHWRSTVWIDGRKVGEGDSLGTPHEFDLGNPRPGKHLLTLRVDNRMGEINVGPLSHSMTDHTQGNWNGVVGKMELRHHDEGNRIHNVRVLPSATGNVILHVSGKSTHQSADGPVITVRDLDAGLAVVGRGIPKPGPDGSFNLEIIAKLTDPVRKWDEFTPNLYRFSVDLESGDDMPADTRAVSFGIREAATNKGRISINGRPAFLRGTLECAIFPLTGHPPTDVGSWKRIISICKGHGLNHIRFHSWCPPEAAFAAADELGFYYQVEVSSWANQGAEIGSGRALDGWMERESKRMLDCYGNHPSFLMMAYGNEPAGRNHAKWLQDWVARRQAEDPRRLYTTGAGWTVMPGSDFDSTPTPRIQQWGEGNKSNLNSQPPRTDFDWRDRIAKHGDTPVVSHEIGQWCAYPDFDEIDKYTGHFKARNFEIFRETARRNGLLGQAREFLMASGKWQAACYKHEIEAALRTPRFGGFQLLDLHDFPGQGTALVGVLDAFWDSKGYITAGEFKRFCGPIVPLARLPRMVWQTNETLTADVQLSHFGPDDLTGIAVPWALRHGERVVASGKLDARDISAGELHDLGSIRIDLADVAAPTMLTLEVGDDLKGFANDWQVFVYPAQDAAAVPASVLFTGDLDEALGALERGGRVIWSPPAPSIADDPDRPLVAGFSPIFWNTAWTNWQPPHTLGILCDPAHPALASFPTRFHSDWQWWELQKDARPFILTRHHDLKPVVQVIDDWFTNRKLGYVFEARVGKGHLIACAFDLTRDLQNRPAARQLRASLLARASAPAFEPDFATTPEALRALLGTRP